MADISIDGVGAFTYDSAYYGHRSRPLRLPMFERDVTIVLSGFLDDPAPREFHDVVRNLLAQTRETLLAVSGELQNYCSDINNFLEPEDELHVDDPHDLWNHVQFGSLLFIKRRRRGDRKLYASIECECDWEPEHGLQIVLREGLAVTKLGPYNEHLSNADACADPSRESTIYRRLN